MNLQSASVTFITNQLGASRNFYETHFAARASFDCGWYVVLQLPTTAQPIELCLMTPQAEAIPFSGGAFLNLQFDDVDLLYQQCLAAGLQPSIDLADHPWGDRGFGITDPAGIIVYCYQPIPAAPEFQQFFTQAPNQTKD